MLENKRFERAHFLVLHLSRNENTGISILNPRLPIIIGTKPGLAAEKYPRM